jgi:nitrate reductase (NAD(P)H)
MDWEFSVEGLVEKPFKLTVRELISDYDQITLPITLVCAGNRRKEQNQVRKSKGFSWGPAGVSTALFTGVAMMDVIKKAKPLRKAKYVCMEGADKLPNGFYGTSVKLNWVLDPNKGIMLAHMMNGEPLRPDHGKPIRAVVPGAIGGRSVKWLTKLIVTEGPSDNWYHIYDNRVLPTTVSPDESSKDDKWWRDERYAIYDLNVNSAIAYPAHEERLTVSKNGKYTIKGYAYGGGGRRVTRVEVSLVKGQSWILANIEYPEDKYREADAKLYGGDIDMHWRETSFCWCFWSLELSHDDLKDAKDIVVRAMDEGMNLQPKDMYWSVLGMMNNPWFRITITPDGDKLRFEHPTQPALMPGGWMEKVKKQGGDLSNGNWGETTDGAPAPKKLAIQEIVMTKEGVDKVFDLEEFKAHTTKEAPWFVVSGQVYDGQAFLEGHPGGAQSIMSAAGMDASEEFLAIHSETAKAMMPDYHIGSLDEASLKKLAEPEVPASTEPRDTFLQTKFWTKAPLVSKKIISWDTRVFTFELEHPEQKIGLPVGQHLMMRLKDPSTNENIIRSYTPISETTDEGKLEILIKVYFGSDSTPGGKLTMALDATPLGATIDFKGPIGKFEYLGRGNVALNGVTRFVKNFAMVCGGSGITPIFQVLRAVMQDDSDPTTCIVLNSNRLFEDILCKTELDLYASHTSQKCKLHYTLTKAPDEWSGLKGRISHELVSKHIVRDGMTMVLICGPEPLEHSVKGFLQKDGWEDSDLVFF